MENTKIAFFEVKEWEREYLTKQLNASEADFFAEKLSLENTDKASGYEIISVFVDSQIDKEMLDKLPDVKIIATRSTGFDHINIEECKKRGISVCNVPFYGENTVAEHTFALILDLSRKIYQSVDRVKEEGFAIEGLMGFDLKGKTLGIVGMGHIGQHVARIAQGFEMNVVATDAHEDKKLAKKLGFTYASLEELLKNSDIITLHVPYNEHTRHLINLGNIGTIKKGAYLINTARGGIIETAALVEALGKGIIAGAGLDVLEEEFFVKEEAHLLSSNYSEKSDIKTMLQNHILMDRKNVIITPHNAFNSREALERILETTVENIRAFEENKPVNIVS
ncbi:MAG: hydroxyacid dehydrogenase [bacterium]|nr:hydroxyacid dehydrogenase [bacterium]